MSKLKHALRNCILVLLIIFLNKCNFGSEKSTPKLYVVEIKQMQFLPALLKIHSGDTIVWVNHDFVTHDVTEETNKKWSSSQLPAGASWQMVAKESADYYCSIHQVMKGKLVVEQ